MHTSSSIRGYAVIVAAADLLLFIWTVCILVVKSLLLSVAKQAVLQLFCQKSK